MAYKWELVVLTIAVFITLCLGSASTNAGNKQGTQRQVAAGGTGILSALGSMVPGVVSNMLPLVLLFGLGALMVPALGLGLLLREGKRRSFPSFNINTSAIMDGAHDVLERVMKALDNVDKKYN